ncbi:serine hydrolase domain-containing protein [Soonwooa sp.]|uniref:serine hydrolase domain-containing protein n=1 Tax=Soonwooa sp. TaxID=1938592 RepID=UPI0028B0A887|nr:serine hydrolase domain-containing protein [Soonwooa sp.]
MKNHFHFYFLFVFLIGFQSCKKAEEVKVQKRIDQKIIEDSISLAKKSAEITPLLDSIILKIKFNAIVSVNWDGKKIYERANGFSNFTTETKINNQTLFPIASNSKQFAGVLILQLQEQHKLNIEDKVSQYLQDYKTKTYQDITISQLLHHTSGINFIGERLLFKSGTAMHYSNDGYKSLGDIVEKLTGQSYDDKLMALFQKLGMAHSSTGNLYNGDNFASAHLGSLKQNKEVPNMPKRLDKNNISIAAGGILSTADDLHLWNQSLYSGKVLSDSAFQTFIKPAKTFDHYILGKVKYACGIMIHEENPKTYLHTGYVKGAPSLVMFYPETKTSVVILSNIANEKLGKKAIYKSHREIRAKIDSLQILWTKAETKSSAI